MMQRQRLHPTGLELAPSINPSNGRGPGGKFAKGNPGGPGNPRVALIQKYRGEILSAVSPSDIHRIFKKLVELAVGGDTSAAKLVLDRTLGREEVAVVVTASDGFDPDETFI